MLLTTSNRPDDNYLQTKLTTGSFGFIKTNQIVSASNDTYRVKLMQSYQHTDGYRANNNYDNRNYTVLAGMNKGNHQLSMLFHHININAQIPSSLSREDFENNPEKAAFTWENVNGYEDYSKSVMGVTYSTFEESYDWDLFRTEDGAQGDQFQGNAELRKAIQLYAMYTLDVIDNLEVEIGLNANLTGYTLDDYFNVGSANISGSYDYSWIYSPRLNLKYSFHENEYIYGLVSHGYSIPTVEETLTPDGLINNDIKPEIGLNTEMGYRSDASDRLTYGLSVYHMSVQDLLVARRTAADQFIGINAGGSRHIGVEIDLKYFILKSDHWNFNFDLAYTHQRFTFTDFVDGDNDYSGNELTGAIPNQVAIGWNMRFKKMSFHAKYKYVDQMPMRDDNSIYSDTYSLLDVYLSESHSIGKFDFDISVGVNNLLDTDYASMILINAGSFGGSAPRYFYPGLPINIFAQTSIKYNF